MSSCFFSKFFNLCTTCQSHVVSFQRRAQVLALLEAGNLMHEIFLLLRIPRSIEQEIISRFRNTRNYHSRHLLGRRVFLFVMWTKMRFLPDFRRRWCGGFVDISASSICPYDDKLFGSPYSLIGANFKIYLYVYTV